MKRYKIRCNGGEYSTLTEDFPQWLWDMINSADIDSGSVSIPSPYGGEIVYHWSLIPDEHFPEDMIDTIHRICAELRTMAETIEGIDSVQFRQTAAVLRSSASRMTASAKRETERNDMLSGNCDWIELKSESSGLCPYHEKNESGFHHFLNPDCPVCERELDRLNDEQCEYHSAE